MLTRISPIDGEAILTIEEAREQVRVLDNRQDAIIGALRRAAIAHVEKASGVILAPSSFTWQTSRFPGGGITLPVKPVTAINSITHFDADGATTNYPGARLIGREVHPANRGVWPSANGWVSVSFSAGLDNVEDTAPDLLAAVRLLLGHLFENREGSTDKALKEIPMGISALIFPHTEIEF